MIQNGNVMTVIINGENEMMIKTEFFDEQYNEVEPENAKLIVQLTLDDKGIVTKRTEWVPKKKSGYPDTTSWINDDVDNEWLSKSLELQQIETISETKKIIKYLWKHYDEVSNDVEKSKILDILNHTYETLRNALEHWGYEMERRKTSTK